MKAIILGTVLFLSIFSLVAVGVGAEGGWGEDHKWLFRIVLVAAFAVAGLIGCIAHIKMDLEGK